MKNRPKIALVTDVSVRHILTCIFFLILFSSSKEIFSIEKKDLTYKSKGISELQLLIDRQINTINSRFNGVILITQGQNLIYQKTLGEIKNIPLNFDSQFIIGSLSKQITAVLILSEVEKHTINLTNSVKSYLPDLQNNWIDTVTIHHLLNHTSGIRSIDAPLDFEPGSQFAYSNVGYDLLGKILENVTGHSFDKLVNNLFSKIPGTKNTEAPTSGTFDELKLHYPNLAIGQIETEENESVFPLNYRKAEHNPSGGIISSVTDLDRWNHSLHSGLLLKNNSYDLLVSPSITRNHRWGTLGYGYGVQLLDDEDISEISHNGIIPGYVSSLIYYPDQKISVVILENNNKWPRQWDESEIIKVFCFHDTIRQLVKNYIKENF